MTITISDRIYGCFFGGAIGDAMGYPVEFMSMKEIGYKYGPDGIEEPPRPALYTDDTQMTLRVAQGLLQAINNIDEHGLINTEKWVAAQLIQWRTEDPPRAPGISCLYGVANLEKGLLPSTCGKPDSKGCGAVMRSAPYGMLFENDGVDGFALAASFAGEHAKMTHLHDAASASAAALAVGVWSALHGDKIDELVEQMAISASVYDERTGYMIKWASALAKDDQVTPASVLNEWRGWTGDEAIASSVYCFVKKQDDFGAAIRLAVNSPGDSDSLGAITGNLCGAYLGVTAIPQDWLDRIENSALIKKIADGLIAYRIHAND